eukprot:1189655-Prymnesium_polylepis.1
MVDARAAVVGAAAGALSFAVLWRLAQTRRTPIVRLNHWLTPGICAPIARYVNGTIAKCTPRSRILQVSGMLGCTPEGTFPASCEEQCDLAFENVRQCLLAAGMTWEHLMKVTVFLTDRSQLPAYRKARDRALGDILVASSLIIVQTVADHVLVEIEATAVGP